MNVFSLSMQALCQKLKNVQQENFLGAKPRWAVMSVEASSRNAEEKHEEVLFPGRERMPVTGNLSPCTKEQRSKFTKAGC